MSRLELIAVLMSWASNLTGYPMPSVDEFPAIQYKNHEFFREHACNNQKSCPVVGWYRDDGVVYIDLAYKTRIHDGFASGLIVHELVHFLQDKYGHYGQTCDERISREREAYTVQRIYMEKNTGTVQLIAPKPVICKK